MRLLSIDWDYFLPMPGPDNDRFGLYDWGAKEAPLYMGTVLWASREWTLRMAGEPIPQMIEDRHFFWNDFNISPLATLYYGESHSWAAEKQIADGITEVWSYDAHHDCGYNDSGVQMQSFEKMAEDANK